MSVSHSIVRTAAAGAVGVLISLSSATVAAADPPPAPEAAEVSDCTNPWYINPVKCLLTSLSAS